jgi:hypothetical protein
LKPVKIGGPDVTNPLSDILDLAGYVRFGGWICPIKVDLALRKNKSVAKTMNLRPDKLMACKLNTIELREIMGITRSNPNTSNHTWG